MHRFTKVTSFVAGKAKCLARDESGTTAIEYAIISTGIAVAIIAAVTSLGTATTSMYDTVGAALK